MAEDKKLTGYPSIDKPWLKYFREADLNSELPQCSVYKTVFDNNKDYLKSNAVNFFGSKISYGKLFKRIDECTKSLKQVGIKRGDCVTLCTAGVPAAIYIVLACSRIGAIANFINPLFSKEQMIARINETEAKWIFVLDEMYHFIEEALDDTCIEHVVLIPVTNSITPVLAALLYLKSKARKIKKNKHKIDYISYHKFAKMGSSYSDVLDDEYKRDTPVIMVYSSGTTGASKGILLTNESVNAIIQNYRRDKFYGKQTDTFLSMIPVWFSTGIVLSVIMPLAHGVCVIPEPQFSKESFAKDLMKYKPTLTLTATSLWLYVATAEETKNIDLSNMIYPSTGGEKISEKDELMLNNFLESHGCQVHLLKGYGMCEFGSEVTGTTATEGYSSKIGSTGYPILNSIVSAFDIKTDEELTYGKHGEIRVCSPARMKEYYKNPKATQDFFKTDAQGRVWGCTGDIGYVDEDGEVFVLGRASDHYQRNSGEIIYFFDIEDEILKDEAVNQCKVIDAVVDGGISLVGHIVLQEQCKDAEKVIKRIDKMVRMNLPDYMVPEYYKIRQSMPVHSNGKRDIGSLKKDIEGLIKP